MYGLEANPVNDPLVHLVELAMESLEGLTSGAYLVDLFPIRKSCLYS